MVQNGDKEYGYREIINKHPVDISKLSVDEMDKEIKKGFQDMLADNCR
ncbi:MAG: hypothetical protein RR347_07780 [Anaerovoracaceae bacterium]